MNKSKAHVSPDRCGQWVNGICLIHCLATPFVFSLVPAWWLSGAESLLWAVMALAILWSSIRTSPWRTGAWKFFALGLALLVTTHQWLSNHIAIHISSTILSALLLAYAHHRQQASHHQKTCCASQSDAIAPSVPTVCKAGS